MHGSSCTVLAGASQVWGIERTDGRGCLERVESLVDTPHTQDTEIVSQSCPVAQLSLPQSKLAVVSP